MLCKLRTACLVVLMSAGLTPTRADDDQLTQTLQPGATVEHPLTADEVHTYTAELESNRRWLVTVEQLGIDVILEATLPDGTMLAVDAPTFRQGQESLLLPAGTSGNVRIVVRPASKAVGPGRYQIAIQELKEATEGDRRRLAAEAAMSEAATLNHQGTPEVRRQAAVKYLEALAEWRHLGDRRQEARALFSHGTLSFWADEPKRALDAYRLALPLYQELDEREAQAILLSDMGLARWKLGDNDRARELLDEAITLQRSLGNRYGEAITRNNLCLRSHSRGELTEARDCYRQALELLRELGELKFESLLLSNLGSVYSDLGEPRLAIESHQQALALRRDAGDRAGQARTLNSLAVVYRRIGELQEALSRYGQALEIHREVADRRREAVTLNNIGAAYNRLGEPQRAIAYLEKALGLRRELGNPRGEAITLSALGQAHTHLGNDDKALALHQQALDLRRAAGDRRGEASTLTLIGQALAASGEATSAITLFEQAVEISEALQDRRETATTLAAKGRAHLVAGGLQPAQASLNRALELHRAVGDRHGEAQALYDLARAERQLDRQDSAQQHVESALDVIESLRTRVSDPGLRATFLASQRSAYELYIDLLMELHGREPHRGFARLAFEASERARARSLLDLLNGASADVGGGIDPDLSQRRGALLERLNAKADRRLQLLGRGRDQQAAELELYSVLAELERVEAEIRETHPGSSAFGQPRPLDAQEIMPLLGSDTLLLEIALGDERSFLWVLGTESLTAFQLPGRTVLESAAREAHRQLATLDVRAEEADAVSRLGQLLLGPIADLLDGQRLVVVADGALHYVPFSTLPVPGLGEPLIARHEIVHLASASSLVLQRRHLEQRSPAAHWAAVLADPVFDVSDPRLGIESPLSQPAGDRPRSSSRLTRDGSSASTTAQGMRFDRLPSTRREARSIAELAPSGETMLALDFNASRELVLGGGLGQYRTLHFATHGLIDASRPELSGLVLSQVDSEGSRRDGFLRLRDIYHLELGADLVVLSGCRTAWGREIRGEGLVGLTRGFMAAGVPRVVASLWRVEDRVTAELMKTFYHSMWRDGLSPSAALRQAQLSVMRERRWRDAYYWGAFILQGDWR